LSVAEQKQGRDAADVVLGGELRMPFGIEFVGANGTLSFATNSSPPTNTFFEKVVALTAGPSTR